LEFELHNMSSELMKYLALYFLLFRLIIADVIELDDSNFDATLSTSSDLWIIDFYAVSTKLVHEILTVDLIYIFKQ
jgi:hypothetical protein